MKGSERTQTPTPANIGYLDTPWVWTPKCRVM